MPHKSLDQAWRGESVDDPAFIAMIASLRNLLNGVASVNADPAILAELTLALDAWTDRLQQQKVPIGKQQSGRQYGAPGRGSAMLPAFVATLVDDTQVRGTVTFGRFYCGANSAAVHGGAVLLLFDDVLGRLANVSGPPKARTAYLHTDFRAVTPVEQPLELHAWIESDVGRKRILHGELRHGDTLCASAKCLFMTLLPGQP